MTIKYYFIQRRRLLGVVAVIALFLTVANPLLGSPSTVLTIDDNQSNQVIIRGSSTVRDWSCQTDDVKGRFQFATQRSELVRFLDNYRTNSRSGTMATSVDRLPVSRAPVIKVDIPIKSFDCGRQAMNEDMYEALKADKQPNIAYLFYGVDRVNGQIRNQPDMYELTTTGGVALGGEANTITFPVRLKRTGDLSFVANGTMDLKMKEFGVKPPTALFGLIKAYNDISISFRLHVSGDSTPKPTIDVPSSLNR